MTTLVRLTPANELAKKNGVRLPNESSEYRIARNSLLAEEIELRRHIGGLKPPIPARTRAVRQT